MMTEDFANDILTYHYKLGDQVVHLTNSYWMNELYVNKLVIYIPELFKRCKHYLREEDNLLRAMTEFVSQRNIETIDEKYYSILIELMKRIKKLSKDDRNKLFELYQRFSPNLLLINPVEDVRKYFHRHLMTDEIVDVWLHKVDDKIKESYKMLLNFEVTI
jgi:hypothetical protein